MNREDLEHVIRAYAHGVGPETAVLPRGWPGRLIPIRTENTQLLGELDAVHARAARERLTVCTGRAT